MSKRDRRASAFTPGMGIDAPRRYAAIIARVKITLRLSSGILKMSVNDLSIGVVEMVSSTGYLDCL
jgi:hypothetical protein